MPLEDFLSSVREHAVHTLRFYGVRLDGGGWRSVDDKPANTFVHCDELINPASSLETDSPALRATFAAHQGLALDDFRVDADLA